MFLKQYHITLIWCGNCTGRSTRSRHQFPYTGQVWMPSPVTVANANLLHRSRRTTMCSREISSADADHRQWDSLMSGVVSGAISHVGRCPNGFRIALYAAWELSDQTSYRPDWRRWRKSPTFFAWTRGWQSTAENADMGSAWLSPFPTFISNNGY